MSNVWETLSTIDVNDKLEKKGKFSYLSWSWCWAKLMEHYPDSTHELHEDITYPDGTMEVRVTVTVEGIARTCWLPVLDYQNKPIQIPNAFDVNTARMRCLVKAVALHGLGLYVFSGEDLPAPDPALQAKYDTLVSLVANKDGWTLRMFSEKNKAQMDNLFNMAPQGHKTKFKDDVRELYGKTNESMKATIAVLEDAVGNPDTQYNVVEVINELDVLEKQFVWTGMDEILRRQVENKLNEEQ